MVKTEWLAGCAFVPLPYDDKLREVKESEGRIGKDSKLLSSLPLIYNIPFILSPLFVMGQKHH